MQKRNRDWFRIKNRANNFNKPQSNDGRVFVEWKRNILQEVDNKIISLKHRIKVHKINPVLKQDTVIEYLNELHEKYVFLPIDKAVNNIAIICKKHCVTVFLKEIGILDAGNETYK